MRPGIRKLLVVGLLLLFLFFSGYALEDTKAYSIAKLTDKDEEFLVVLTGRAWQEFGSEVIIYSLDGGRRELLRWDASWLNPWKLMTGDIDGDGIEEISIGVYKESPLHPVMAKRPFIYSFDGEQIVPKWRGSRLSRPFEDYLLYDIDKDGVCEIVASERLENGKMLLNSYKWRGFGFEGFKESKELDRIENLSNSDGRITFMGENQGRKIKAELTLGIEGLEWREY